MLYNQRGQGAAQHVLFKCSGYTVVSCTFTSCLRMASYSHKKYHLICKWCLQRKLAFLCRVMQSALPPLTLWEDSKSNDLSDHGTLATQ